MGTFRTRMFLAVVAVVVAVAAPSGAQGRPEVGREFPDGFDVPVDASLNQPVLGFGGPGPVERTPVIFLHGNNDTPYPTRCNGSYGAIQAFAQHFADRGYALGELWALGYQGDQCDLLTDQRRRAGEAHTTVANVPDLRAFVRAVRAYTGAERVDLVGHSLGATLAREWMRQDDAYRYVRRLVAIDAPNHGIINCSPSPANYYATIGFVPDSPICQEYGAADTPLLRALNAGDETPGPTEYLAIVNVDASFVYMSKQDGVLPPVPPQDRTGAAHDFSRSALLEGARTVELTGQGIHDRALLAAHTGIVASPDAWQATFEFLTEAATEPAGGAAAPTGSTAPATPSPATLPATGTQHHAPAAAALLAGALALGALTRRSGRTPGG